MINDPFEVKAKAVLLVSAWDAVDAGDALSTEQQQALEDWQFECSINGRSDAEQELDRKVLRTVVRLSRGST